MPASDRYSAWNRALVQHCLLSEEGGSVVHLAITPSVLSAASHLLDGARMTEDAAEGDFVETVAGEYRSRALGSGIGVSVWRGLDPNRLPASIAFLGFCVLAACHMERDEGHAAHAFYPRLAELLRVDVDGGPPSGFIPAEYEALWRDAAVWLYRWYQRKLVCRPTNSMHRFVGIALAHVPLRNVDLTKLPEFFSWADYAPMSDVPDRRLCSDLKHWARGPAAFTRAGREAVTSRIEVVSAQVRQALATWGGGDHLREPEAQTGRLQLLLCTSRRGKSLSLIAARPDGFPEQFRPVGTDPALTSSQDGWYDPDPLDPRRAAELLGNGQTYQSSNGTNLYRLARRGSKAVAFLPHDNWSGLVSADGLHIRVSCTVVCHRSVAGTTRGYLAQVTGEDIVGRSCDDVAVGWHLFDGVRPCRDDVAPPAALSDLHVFTDTRIVLSGGLRAGRRAEWLVGAPPTIHVLGWASDMNALLDEQPVEVDEDCRVVLPANGIGAGEHQVVAGPARRRFTVLEPEIRHCGPETGAAAVGQPGTAVPLPAGRWTVLGRPGEVRTRAVTGGGGLVTMPFRPVWAIRDGVPGTCEAVYLREPGQGDTLPPRVFGAQVGGRNLRWANSLARARRSGTRHGSLYPGISPEELARQWRAVVRLSEGILRQQATDA